LFLVNRTEK